MTDDHDGNNPQDESTSENEGAVRGEERPDNEYYNFLNVGDRAASEDGSTSADADGLHRGMKAMSPGGLIMHRHPGRALDTRKDSRNSGGSRERTNSDASTTTKKEELPEVHNSPTRANRSKESNGNDGVSAPTADL